MPVNSLAYSKASDLFEKNSALRYLKSSGDSRGLFVKPTHPLKNYQTSRCEHF
jgi:hypothetical protein